MSNYDKLISELLKIPVNLSKVEAMLSKGEYPIEDINRAGYELVDSCFMDVEYPDGVYEPYLVEGKHSTYLKDIIALLLRYGLDPNAIVNDDNILHAVIYVTNGYVAADTLSLLLEHGGRIDLSVDNEMLFSSVDFDIIFSAVNGMEITNYVSLVHCWFVLLGYSNNEFDGKQLITIIDGTDEHEEQKFKVSDLIDHRNFYHGITKTPSRGENWSLHIFDKRTNWEVARL